MTGTTITLQNLVMAPVTRWVVEWFINHHRVTDAVRKVLAVLCDRGAGNPVVEDQPPGDRHRSGMSAQARHRSGAEAAPKRQAAPAPSLDPPFKNKNKKLKKNSWLGGFVITTGWEDLLTQAHPSLPPIHPSLYPCLLPPSIPSLALSLSLSLCWLYRSLLSTRATDCSSHANSRVNDPGPYRRRFKLGPSAGCCLVSQDRTSK